MAENQSDRYIRAVMSGAEPVCELTRCAVARHLSDLKKKDWAFVYVPAEAEKAIRFVRMLRHTSGALGGRPFNLQDNQAFILSMLFGWRRKDNGLRRFTQAYMEMARKSGKSELAASIEIYCGFCEKEEGAQVYTAATTRDQADMVFRAVKKMARGLRKDSPAFAKLCEVRAHSVNFSPTDSLIQKVSADAGTLDGLNPHCAVIDEYHAHKTDEVKGVMQTGMGAREAPFLAIITTAGFDKDAPCFRVERKNAVAVLTAERKQDNLFAIIFTLDEGDDWRDEKVWKKANPNLGSTPTMQYLREQVQDAINKGSSTMVQVMTKNFNIWCDAPKVWIPDEQVKACLRPVDWSEFKGRKTYVGVDLASVKDIAAAVFFSPGDDERPAITKPLYFLPEATISARDAETSYREWVEGGYLRKTPGGSIDFQFIRAEINRLHEEGIDIAFVAFDQWNSASMATDMQNDGYNVIFLRQFFSYLSQPTKRLEKFIIDGEIVIDDNPATAWMFRNVVLDRNASDDVKPNKDKSGDKIDGVAALLDAMFAWMTDPQNEFVKSYLFS